VLILSFLMTLSCVFPSAAAQIERNETPNYVVAFYESPNYHIKDEDGRLSGYGYDMMQEIEKHLQCTFSYEGYELTPAECEEKLLSGEIDVYTAAKKTPERDKDFAFSIHPAITATTCLNIKLGNKKIVPGDYSTYDGCVVGLLETHSYNDLVKNFAKSKGFECEIKNFGSPTELRRALVSGEVDMILDSYIRVAEDQVTIEIFGETPYYFMVRKEDKEIVDLIDSAIDSMNINTPNWRTELYTKYYGAHDVNAELTPAEAAYLEELLASGAVIHGIMGEERKPYSWFEENEPRGIVADIFAATAEELGLRYEVLRVNTKEEYYRRINSGEADIWLDIVGSYEGADDNMYKLTEPYLTTTMSILRLNESQGKIGRVAVVRDNADFIRIINENWPSADIIILNSTEDCLYSLIDGRADAALMRSYRAEYLSDNDNRNRYRVEVVPNSSLSLMMGVNSQISPEFLGIWTKTLRRVAAEKATVITQKYLEESQVMTLERFLFLHPAFIVGLTVAAMALILVIILWIFSIRRSRQQRAISEQLAVAVSDLRDSNEKLAEQTKLLEEARDQAETANKSKSTFLFNMSHDIRTPMNAIIGFRDLLEKHQDEPERRGDYLRKIKDASDVLLSIINNVLEMARIEKGTIVIEEKACCAEQFNDALFSIFDELMSQKSISFTRSLNVEHAYVYCDPIKLREIFVNILSNACKYTNPGGRVDMSLTELPSDREGYALYRTVISDTGVGMSEEFLPHVFEEFSRERNTTDSKIEGTGLGMPIVKKLVELLGGSIDVKSKKGEGTTITVTLSHRIASKEDVTEMSSAEYDTSLFKGRHILLAEDNDLNAEIANEILKEAGFEVTRARDGLECVEKLKNAENGYFDLILMDIQMPNMNGYEATRTIRAMDDAFKSGIIIIAMTANAFEEDKRRAFEAGMNGHIAKPINISDLMVKLAEAISGMCPGE
ncbi:MAG: transporter substrate-binding domain-containing protein, partial [Eubacteriales bacterium]|nr:transporter substrate-binding domain-containing protein [Eubacteriales bacterium]